MMKQFLNHSYCRFSIILASIATLMAACAPVVRRAPLPVLVIHAGETTPPVILLGETDTVALSVQFEDAKTHTSVKVASPAWQWSIDRVEYSSNNSDWKTVFTALPGALPSSAGNGQAHFYTFLDPVFTRRATLYSRFATEGYYHITVRATATYDGDGRSVVAVATYRTP